MHLADILIIAAYMLTLIAIGLRVSRGQKTTDTYFIADRSVPGWAAGLSLLATIITSVTFIAYPGAAYAGDWTLLVPGIMFVAVIAAIGPVVVPFFRHVVSMSVYEYFGQRFGQGVRMYASFAFATGHFAKMGFVFYLLALSVSGITGWPIVLIIVGLGIITIFYTFIGGLEAVIWTDVVQGFLLWTGVAVTIGLLLASRQTTAGAMWHLIVANHKMDLGGLSFNLAKPTFWTMAIYGLFFYLQKYTADQTVVQRYLAARTDRSAIRGMALGASLCLPIWAAFMLIGSLLWAFYRLTGQTLSAVVTRPDQVFPHYMVTQMPVGVGAGLFLAALFGAAMSMLRLRPQLSRPHSHRGLLQLHISSQHRPAAAALRQTLHHPLRVSGDRSGFAALDHARCRTRALLHGDRYRRGRTRRALSACLPHRSSRPHRRHRRHRRKSRLHSLGYAYLERWQVLQPALVQLSVA